MIRRFVPLMALTLSSLAVGAAAYADNSFGAYGHSDVYTWAGSRDACNRRAFWVFDRTGNSQAHANIQSAISRYESERVARDSVSGPCQGNDGRLPIVSYYLSDDANGQCSDQFNISGLACDSLYFGGLTC